MNEKLIEFKRKLENRTEEEKQDQLRKLHEFFDLQDKKYNELKEENKIELLKIGGQKAVDLYEKYDIDYYFIIKDALLSGITIDKLTELFETYEDEKIKSMFGLEEFIGFMINLQELKSVGFKYE